MRLLTKSLTVAMILLGSLSTSDAAEPKWTVNPDINSAFPSVTVTGIDAETHVKFATRTIDDATPLVLDTVRDTVVGNAYTYRLPAVGEDTFVRVEAWLGDEEKEPDFGWNTLLRPEGLPLIEYAGQQTMLPPEDFDEFWQRAKEELAKVPMEAVVREIAEKHTATGLLYEVELAVVGEQKIICWLTIPRAAYDDEGNVIRRFPAAVVMPGYGAEEPPLDRTPSGMITLSVNPRNHGPSKRFWTAPSEHLTYGIDDPETFYYRLAFLDCLRAAEYLFTRPEVDPDRVAAEGGSQGGLLAIALGTLEPRIRCVVSNVTAFSALPEGMILNTIGGATSFRRLLEEGGDLAEQRTLSLRYVDAANMVTRLRVPLQINMAGQDPVCSFVTGIVIYNRLPNGVPREYNIVPDARHEVPGPMRQWNANWMQQWLELDEAPSLPGAVL